MKKQKEESKYIHASFIGKVWEGNNINEGKRKNTPKPYIYPHLYIRQYILSCEEVDNLIWTKRKRSLPNQEV